MEKVFHTKQMNYGALDLMVLLHYSQCNEEEEYTESPSMNSLICMLVLLQFIDKTTANEDMPLCVQTARFFYPVTQLQR